MADTPEKLFVQMFGPKDPAMDKTFHATEYDPREVHDNGKPVYVYLCESAHQKAVATLEAERDALREALTTSQGAIRSLPDDALGQDPQDGFYYKDQLLDQIKMSNHNHLGGFSVACAECNPTPPPTTTAADNSLAMRTDLEATARSLGVSASVLESLYLRAKQVTSRWYADGRATASPNTRSQLEDLIVAELSAGTPAGGQCIPDKEAR